MINEENKKNLFELAQNREEVIVLKDRLSKLEEENQFLRERLDTCNVFDDQGDSSNDYCDAQAYLRENGPAQNSADRRISQKKRPETEQEDMDVSEHF